MLPLSVEDLTVRSRAVVRATVRQQQSSWDEGHRRIYTLTELAVSEVIHGEAPATILVRTMGGEVDGIGMKVSGTTRLMPNQDVVLFLRNDPGDTSGFMVVGMSQGFYRVERDTAGRTMAVPGMEGVAFVRNGREGPLVDHSTDAVRMPYDQFRARVRTAATTPVPTPIAPEPQPKRGSR